MRLLPICIVLFAASLTIPAICQSSTSKSNLVTPGESTTGGTTTAQPPAPSTPAVSAAALHADMQRQDKVIKNQIDNQQNLRKKNKELMKQAEKLDEKNKKLEAK